MQSLHVSVTTAADTLVNDGMGLSDSLSVEFGEHSLLLHNPRQNIFMQVTLQLRVHHANAAEGAEGVAFKADQVLLTNNARDVLHMSSLALLLPSLLLVSAAFALSFDTSLCSLEALRLDELSVAHFFVPFLLVLHDSELCLFKHLHAGLLKRFEAKDIKHGLDLGIEVE